MKTVSKDSIIEIFVWLDDYLEKPSGGRGRKGPALRERGSGNPHLERIDRESSEVFGSLRLGEADLSGLVSPAGLSELYHRLPPSLYRNWRRRSIKFHLYPFLKFLQRYYKKVFRPRYWL